MILLYIRLLYKRSLVYLILKTQKVPDIQNITFFSHTKMVAQCSHSTEQFSLLTTEKPHFLSMGHFRSFLRSFACGISFWSAVLCRVNDPTTRMSTSQTKKFVLPNFFQFPCTCASARLKPGLDCKRLPSFACEF